MIMLKRSIAAATAAGLFALAGISGANAAETTSPVVKKVAEIKKGASSPGSFSLA